MEKCEFSKKMIKKSVKTNDYITTQTRLEDHASPFCRGVGAVFTLGDEGCYSFWRQKKLARLQAAQKKRPMPIANPLALTKVERDALLAQIAEDNMALYSWEAPPGDQELDQWLLAFATSFGLRAVEDHRSANGNGVVRIEIANGGGRVGYIPYTDKAISWHTDGYYNYHGPAHYVRAMVLHCSRSAENGGENRLLDHELAYLRLREDDENALRLLMHPFAMTIPAATDELGRFRAENVGPVFFVDPFGDLAMRFTARKKFIVWRDEPTRRAAEKLLALIESDPMVVRVKLAAGEGVLCNNVLHDRSGFADNAQYSRLLCRIRFHNSIVGGAER